jgi:DNA-binding transcriptional ArsR family regulator
VRGLQRVIGEVSPRQVLEAARRLPDRVIACVGGGSNAIGMFHPLIAGEGTPLIGAEAGGAGLDTPRHGAAYYDHLQRVRTDGAWEEWLAFFVEGVTAVAGSATETARQIRQLVERDREAIHGVGRGAPSALRVHELAGRRVVLTASSASALLGLSAPTVNAAFARLEDAGILREVTGRRRGRVFVYAAYLELLQAEQ